MSSDVPPGWYNDPSGEARHQRYWDAEKWTGQTRPGPNQARKGLGGVPTWAWVVGTLVVLVVWVGSQFSGEPVVETFDDLVADLGDDASATPTQANDRVSLEGGGDGDTNSFRLAGGSYTVRTQVGNDCYYSFTLRDPSDGSRVDSVTTMSEPGSSTVSIHGVDPGNYFVGVITGPAPDCPWSQIWTSS